ncbi:MAG: bifunctional oligoribonuclease/PAP phosphatase NrnA [Candidatus Omnitrophica bacterium]|nr:bifunctional oligoribonuclease/PAP phosphatase NrnA [Candidatus Omnitrophota bacterium]
MRTDDMKSVARVIRENRNFLISAHINPEGDSIGSQLALSFMLGVMDKRAYMIDQDRVPDNLIFLPGAKNILTEPPADFEPDAALIVDCPVIERTGDVSGYLKKAGLIVNIDHHVSNEYYGDVNWVEEGFSSVGEMMFHLAGELGVRMERVLAENIYAAIVTDTGMFSYNNTSSDTHRVTAELVEAGVDPNFMHAEIFEKKDLAEIKLLGEVLNSLEISEEGKVAHIKLTRGMYSRVGADKVATDEFINYPRSVKGVEIAVFFKESTGEKDKVYVSFRSNGKVDVNRLASLFGGGGHQKASGCMLACGMEEAVGKVLSEAEKVLQQ